VPPITEGIGRDADRPPPLASAAPFSPIAVGICAGRQSVGPLCRRNQRERRMLVHIFRGPGRVFGCTNDATGANLPAQYRPWSSFKSLDLSRDGEPTAGVNASECLDDIEKYGFHITDAHVRITENLV
jgi:hypothetical protein